MKKLSKIGIISMTLIIISSLMVCGALMSYYINTTINVDSGVLFEYSTTGVYGGEEENCEDLDKTLDFLNFVGNDTEIHDFYIRLNQHANKPHTIKFIITDTSTDNPEGLQIALQWDNAGTWTDLFNWSATQSGTTEEVLLFQPNTMRHLRVWVQGDVYLLEGEHSFLLETVKQAP